MVALIATARPVRADVGDHAVETWSCGDAEDPDAPDHLGISWASGSDDDLLPILTLRTLDRDDLSYRLDGRLRFQGAEWTWTQTVDGVAPYATVEVDLDAAALVPWSAAQADWTSDLAVRVVVLDGAGGERLRRSAPTLRVVWEEDEPRLFTQTAAATLAPGGAWSAAALDVVDALAASDGGAITEMGGQASSMVGEGE